jgi:glycosyltransferase involved in cell wall biosynthesis
MMVHGKPPGRQAPRVVMVLTNPFLPDPRVHKEARALAQAGYDVTVLCWDRQGRFPPREQLDGFEIRRLTVRSGYVLGTRQVLYLPRFWWRALRELRALRPDIVHCHDLDTGLVGCWHALSHRIPWILDAHECYPEQMRAQVGGAIYRILLLLERALTRRATHVITVGETLAQRLRDHGGRVTVVGNYQPLEALASTQPISRTDLGLSASDFVVAYIGGFTVERAILPLIEATDLFTDVRVLLLGDGPQRPAVEAALPTHPLVRYGGWVPQEQVPAYTALADVVYYGLRSRQGNNQYSAPNALFNALAAGKPVLTTDTGEIASIVRQERCGIVVEEAAPPLLAQAMAQLREPAFREPLAVNARRAAQHRYNWAAAETNLLDVYRRITTHARAQ